MAGFEYRNSRFMQQDFENLYEEREIFLKKLRKNKRNQFVCELRQKNLKNRQTHANDSQENKEKHSESPLNLPSDHSKLINEDWILNKITQLYEPAPLALKKTILSELLSSLKYNKQPATGTFISIQETVGFILREFSSLTPETLPILLQLMILDQCLIFDFSLLGPSNSWPDSEDMYKLLLISSWNDQQNELLVKSGVLDFLYKVFDYSKAITHNVLVILANISTGSNFSVTQLMHHRVFEKVMKGLASAEGLQREDSSFVLNNIVQRLGEPELQVFIQGLNFEYIKSALSQHGSVTHKNILSFFLVITEYFPLVYIEESYFDLFLYSKNSELSSLASSILKKIINI